VSWHPTEDDLVLHGYGELNDTEKMAIDDHIHTCARCAAARQDLTEILATVTAADVPEPGEGFERVMWARISQELPAKPEGWFWRQFALSGSLAAALTMAIAVGYSWTRSAPVSEPAPVAAVAPAGTTDEDASGAAGTRVLLTAAVDLLSQAEILLVEVTNAPGQEHVVSDFQRSTADDLVASGRLYRQTARQTGEVQLANMLEDLEPALVEMAVAPAETDRRDFDFLRTRIEDDALLFKVRAVTSEIRGRQQRLMYQQ
jgi:hypothetical protein